MSMPFTADEWPRVSVIVAVRNQARRIGECLQALSRTTYPKSRLEILVMDGESQDNTRQIAEQFSAEGLLIRVLPNPKRTRGAALNRGIAEATGQIIVCVDARNLTPPGYIGACVETLLETGADNVGGVIEPLSETPTQEAVALATSHPFGVGYGPYRMVTRAGYVDTVYLGCFRRSIFERVGLWDERPDVAEDCDMNLRIRESGGRIYQTPRIKMPYRGRDRLSDLLPRFWRCGIQRVGILLKHRKLTAPRQLVSPLFVVALLVLALLSFVDLRFMWAFLGLVGIYLTADLVISAKIAFSRNRWNLLPRLCLAFPSIHFSNALAFMWRLVWRPRSDRYLEN